MRLSFDVEDLLKKTFVVVGATGHVGRSVVERLTAQGHSVRHIARSAGASFDDAAVVTDAFAGASGAFLMVPFDMSAPDLHRREFEIAQRLADAVAAARVRRVVCLSGTSAHLADRAGSGLGASILEQQINSVAVPELVHVRACFLMENFLQSIDPILKTGIFGWPFRPDVATPMIAARDVGTTAAALLTEDPFEQPLARELLGSRDYTMAEAIRIIGSVIGKPDVTYAQVPYADARGAMIRNGASPSFADAVMDTARSFNEGVVWAQERRSPQNTTGTTLEMWARTVFKPAYGVADAKHRAASQTA